MDPQDCTWCGSARSIEYGVCQVCLMRFPEEPDTTRVVIELRDPAAPTEPEIEIEERPVAESAAE